jgi:MFS transporter, DHA1 family, inner membrane transport protein
MTSSLRSLVPVFIAVKIVLNTMVRWVYPFLPVISRGLGVDLETMGRALALRSSAGVLGPFLASVADSRGRKTGMLFGLLLFITGCLVVILWPTFWGFVITLVLTISGNFVFIPSMQAYLGDSVPYDRRGFVLALTEFGWALAFIVGVPLVGVAIARGGWRAPFPFLLGAGIAAFFALAILVPESASRPHASLNLFHNLLRVAASPPALSGLAFGMLLSGANEIVNVVFGVWMEDRLGLQIMALGAASAVIGLSELGGEASVSLLSDRFGKSLSVAAGLLLNCLAAMALPFLGGSLAGALLGLFFFYLTFEFALVSSLPWMTEVLPGVRATYMALYIAGMSLGRGLGALAAPGLYQSGFAANALAAIAINGLALLALLYLRRTLR